MGSVSYCPPFLCLRETKYSISAEEQVLVPPFLALQSETPQRKQKTQFRYLASFNLIMDVSSKSRPMVKTVHVFTAHRSTLWASLEVTWILGLIQKVQCLIFPSTLMSILCSRELEGSFPKLAAASPEGPR